MVALHLFFSMKLGLNCLFFFFFCSSFHMLLQYKTCFLTLNWTFLCFRIEQQFQNVLALWHESHVNMKSVVSWHYLTNEIEAVRAGNVASVCIMSTTGLLDIYQDIGYTFWKYCMINLQLSLSSGNSWQCTTVQHSALIWAALIQITWGRSGEIVSWKLPVAILY